VTDGVVERRDRRDRCEPGDWGGDGVVGRRAILGLLSDEASCSTGTFIDVTGG
jgi:hypothetical protein